MEMQKEATMKKLDLQALKPKAIPIVATIVVCMLIFAGFAYASSGS